MSYEVNLKCDICMRIEEYMFTYRYTTGR